MQCQSQLLSSSAYQSLSIADELRLIDVAWHRNVYPIVTNKEDLQPFGNIESQTIEWVRQDFIKSNGTTIRAAVLGLWTVDVKKLIMYLSEFPEKIEQHRIVVRGNSHKRLRLNSQRFSSPVITGFKEWRDPVYKGKGEGKFFNLQANWLGKTWSDKFNNKYLPSLEQIETGLIAEAMEQLSLSMLDVKSGQVQIDAKHHIQKTWRKLLAKAAVPDRNEFLSKNILSDPLHPVVQVFLSLYSYEGFVYPVMNEATRVGDESKLKTMGPYAIALS